MKIICEIGCGDRKVFDDSIAIDVRHTDKVDIIADGRHLPFKDNTVDYVYSSHVIEHFSHTEVDSVLREWARVLKNGGVFEIRCPDLRMRALLTFISPSRPNISNIYGEQNYEANYHKCGFSYGLLKELMLMSGLSRIRRIYDGYRGIPLLPCDLHMIAEKKDGNRDGKGRE